MDINEIKKQLEQAHGQQSRAAQVLQLVLFLVMFTGLFLLGCKLFSGFWMRALCLILAYFVSSLVLFLVIKPVTEKLGRHGKGRK